MVLQMALFCSFFEWVDSTPLYICTISVDGHSGCFPVVAIVNSAAVNIGVHVFFELRFYPNISPEVGLLDQMVVLYLVF